MLEFARTVACIFTFHAVRCRSCNMNHVVQMREKGAYRGNHKDNWSRDWRFMEIVMKIEFIELVQSPFYTPYTLLLFLKAPFFALNIRFTKIRHIIFFSFYSAILGKKWGYILYTLLLIGTKPPVKPPQTARFPFWENLFSLYDHLPLKTRSCYLG